LLRDRIAKLELTPKLGYVAVPNLSVLDRQLLVERQLISRELASAEGPRGAALGPHETMSLMVNEEDHLRLQGMRSGFGLSAAWRGLYGEGSRPTGHFYQISNQVTLGKSETQILGEIHSVIPQIISYERISRESWLRENRQSLEDRVTHAYDTLRSATMMTSEETME